MGGVGIGFRNVFPDPAGGGGFDSPYSLSINLANPASLSGLPARSFTFDVGMTGSNVYLRQRSGGELLRTSFNTFNISNVTIAFPVAKKLGLALNVSPYSEVGYNIQTDNESHLADLGVMRYYYNGEGDVNEAKAALGWEPVKNLSVGVDVNYLWGYINRSYEAYIIPYTAVGDYRRMRASTTENIGRVYASLGVQYTPLLTAKTRLTLGATYRMGGALNSAVRDYIETYNEVSQDVVRDNQFTSPLYIPQKIGVGAFFHRQKWAAGLDWTYEDWARQNAPDAGNDLKYVNVSTLRLGGRYTPNRYDIRGKVASFFNRITYKGGVVVGSNYFSLKGVPLRERAVTLGIEMPFRAETVSTLSLGVEYGRRGTLASGLVKENYFKVNVGITLFGKDYDYWFEKRKYD